MKGLARVAVVVFEAVGQRLAFLKWDEGQKDIAGERQIECGVGFAMAVAVFLPGAGIALVMVAVFHRPGRAHGRRRAGAFGHREAAQKMAGVAFRRRRRILFLRPVAPDGQGGADSRQPGGDGGNGGDRGAATIQASVFAFLAQVKKGVSLRACAAAASRWEVLALVPLR